MRPPTPAQLSVLRFIAAAIEDDGFPPSLRQIAAQFGWTSTNAVSQFLDALVKKGFLERRPLVSRGLKVTDAGRDLLHTAAQSQAIQAVDEPPKRNDFDLTVFYGEA